MYNYASLLGACVSNVCGNFKPFPLEIGEYKLSNGTPHDLIHYRDSYVRTGVQGCWMSFDVGGAVDWGMLEKKQKQVHACVSNVPCT